VEVNLYVSATREDLMAHPEGHGCGGKLFVGAFLASGCLDRCGDHWPVPSRFLIDQPDWECPFTSTKCYCVLFARNSSAISSHIIPE